MYDKFEQIAGYARLAVGVVGNPKTSEFALVDLTGPEPVPDFRGEAQRGFCFIGVVGMVQGVPFIALTGPLDNAALDALSQAYIRHVECVLSGPPRRNAGGRFRAMVVASLVTPGPAQRMTQAPCAREGGVSSPPPKSFAVRVKRPGRINPESVRDSRMETARQRPQRWS